MTRLASIFTSFIDFVFPQQCTVCGKTHIVDSPESRHICHDCWQSMIIAPLPDKIYSSLSENFQGDDLALSAAYSLFISNKEVPFINVIYKLKYSSFSDIGYQLGKKLGRVVSEFADCDYDFVIPVPIHRARKRERGYNQSDYIGRGITEATEIPFSSTLVKRRHYTQSQTTKNASERKKNVKSAFAVPNPELVTDKTILIADDVLTTGSTTNAVAFSLLEAGAKRIDTATLMKA